MLDGRDSQPSPVTGELDPAHVLDGLHLAVLAAAVVAAPLLRFSPRARLVGDELRVGRQRERRVVHGGRPVAGRDAAPLLALGELLLPDVEVVVLVGGPIQRERPAEVAWLR